MSKELGLNDEGVNGVRGSEVGGTIASMEGDEVKRPKKRGPRPKGEIDEEQNNKEQNKFFIDVSKDSESKEMIINLLAQANNKTHGREIILKDLILAALPKLTSKDIEKIQEGSLTEMEKVERALDEYNKKSDVKLTMGEFLVKKLGIN